MKQVAGAVGAIVLVVSLVAVFFTFKQVEQNEESLKLDLQHRTTLLAESFAEVAEPNFIQKSDVYLQQLVERFSNRERLAGLAIYDNKENITAISSNLPRDIGQSQKIAAASMDSNMATGDFVVYKDQTMYVFAIPLHDGGSVVGALAVVQNASYIDARIAEIWRNSLMRLLIQVFLVAVAILLAIRWAIYHPVLSLVQSVQRARLGDAEVMPQGPFNHFLFGPLAKEVFRMSKSLTEARLAASEEARLRFEKLDSPWTPQRLKELIKGELRDRPIVVISNREPYIHTKKNGKITFYFPASGMVTAIEPIMRACGGLWVAYGSGDADTLVVDKHDRLRVSPDEPAYTLRRVWLTGEEEDRYYYGFSNEGIWPLCHIAHVRPTFRKEDWEAYKQVNGKFAQVVLSEIKDLRRPIVFVQDFHFALLPRMIKKSRPDAVVGLFWHIPWPNPEAFSIFPWKKDFLDGLLGADLVGFHTQLHCNNFIETVGRELESLIDFEQFTVTREGHTSYVKPYPISIAFSNGYEYHRVGEEEEVKAAALLKRLGVRSKYIGVGVDRLDYTKGFLERIKAIEILLKRYPRYQRQFTFIQVAAPSKSKIDAYQAFDKEVERSIERINEQFKTRDWKPIVFVKRHHSHEEINEFYKVANVCLVTSLHDGMNLVAKEFVAARSDENGVLVLSQFTGASRELKDGALIVNPYNGEETAEAIRIALEMLPTEQRKRMRKMREVVRNYNIYRWGAEILRTLAILS